MRRELKLTVIAVFNNIEIAREIYEYEFETLGRDLLKQANVYNEPDDYYTTKEVSFYEMKVKNNQLEPYLIRRMEIVPWCRKRTDDEYNQSVLETVSVLPKEFQDYVQQEAYDRGHSSGYDEVFNYVKTMTHELKPVIEAYTKRLKNEMKN